jgi:Ca2+-binding RTX toxin-like protein
VGGNGADTLSGDVGVDMASYFEHTDSVNADADGETGDDGSSWGEGDTIAADIEELEGGQAADTLTGNAGENFIRGGAGNDTIRGLGGNDWLVGERGADTLAGGDGDDGVSYFEHTAAVTADLDGVEGDDGQAGERDTIGTDVENLEGGSGADTLTGGPGHDGLWGLTGSDRLDGGAGQDYLDGGPQADVLTGGADDDVVSYQGRAGSVTADLTGSVRNDGEKGEGDTISADVEILRGGSGADTLTGNAGDNFIWGGAGNDTIRAGAGDDVVTGSNGTDSVFGEAGDDDVIGEPGPPSSGTIFLGDVPGSDTVRDKVDGGENSTGGDGCFVRAAGAFVNCEHMLGLPQVVQRGLRNPLASAAGITAAGGSLVSKSGHSGNSATGSAANREGTSPTQVQAPRFAPAS